MVGAGGGRHRMKLGTREILYHDCGGGYTSVYIFQNINFIVKTSGFCCM